MTLIFATAQAPVSSIGRPSGLGVTAYTDHSINGAQSKNSEEALSSSPARHSSTVDSWSSKFPILVAGDSTDTPPCTTRLAISRAELAMQANWDDAQYTVAVIQAVWSLVLRAYTGNAHICFGYSSPTEASRIFACDLSDIQTPAQLIEFLQLAQQNYSLPLPLKELDISVCNTALSVLVDDGPSITEVSEEVFKQVSEYIFQSAIVVSDRNKSMPFLPPLTFVRRRSHLICFIPGPTYPSRSPSMCLSPSTQSFAQSSDTLMSRSQILQR